VRGQRSSGGASELTAGRHGCSPEMGDSAATGLQFYEVSSYGFRMTWGTHFTNIGQKGWATPSW
jgi:hypothetical protein